MSDPTPEEAARIGGWIRSQAGEKSLEEILEAVRARLADLYATVRAIPESALAATEGEGWAPIEALKHVVEWNWQVGEDVLHVSLTGERPGNPLPSFEPNRESLIARQEESIESVWAHVSTAEPAAFLDVVWPHPFFGDFNWREWFFFLGVHAIDHTRQLKAMHEALHA